MRVRVFIDFWNFQLNWNDRMDPQRCDWRALPYELVNQAAQLVRSTGQTDALILEETLLYASVDPKAEVKLRTWLENTISRMPSYRVTIRERRQQRKNIHCRHCDTSFHTCVSCGQPYTPRPEKGVDAAIVTDMLSLGFQKSYDLAVLVSGDADFIPAVEYLQGMGVRVINGGWAGHGHELKATCWASFDLGDLAHKVCRQ